MVEWVIMTKTPYFLWDYDTTEADVRRILQGGSEIDKQWLIARILTSAKFDDVWKYLKVGDVVEHFPRLKMRPQIKTNWQRALNVWGYAV